MTEYITIGRIAKPRGTRGQVDVVSLTDFPERFQPGLRVFLVPPLPERRELVIAEVARLPKGLVLLFEGFNTRNDVEPLRDREIAVPAEEVSELPEGSFWIDDLIGLSVVTVDGEDIGRVKNVLQSAGHDIYVVTGADGAEHMIPAVKEIVKEIDLKAGRILIEPIPGLL